MANFMTLSSLARRIIQERTGLLAGWEKAESLKLQRNNTIESDVTG